jgi:hypothetical protein
MLLFLFEKFDASMYVYVYVVTIWFGLAIGIVSETNDKT